MKTYARKTIKGYYIDFQEEIDAEYWEGKIGSTFEDFLANKWIPLSDEQLAFKSEHPELGIKYIIEMSIPEVLTRTLEDAKRQKLSQINQYDKSDAINSFDIVIGSDTITTWITPNNRANYKNSIDAAELIGLEELHPVFNGQMLTISTQVAKMALANIQIYADRCFVVTETHKKAVEELDTIEAVDAYNNETGYPERLTFTL